MALLQVQDLCVSVAQKQILTDINLVMNEGETHVLMGPNGVGKSTLGFTLMGSPTFSVVQGKILFAGQDITGWTPDKRAKEGIFLSFQDPQEVPGLSLEAFIRAALQQTTGQRVKLFAFQKELRQKMQILEMKESYATRDINVGFSGGEKKKAEILQMLMSRPKLAILDETDSGLDVDAVRTVSLGIQEYKKNTNGSILMITHSMRMLENLSIDEVHIMANGRIVKSGDKSLADFVDKNGFDDFVKQGQI